MASSSLLHHLFPGIGGVIMDNVSDLQTEL